MNGYGRGDNDSDDTDYSRIFARHDNPSLFMFFYMSILNDTSSPSPCAEILPRAPSPLVDIILH